MYNESIDWRKNNREIEVARSNSSEAFAGCKRTARTDLQKIPNKSKLHNSIATFRAQTECVIDGDNAIWKNTWMRGTRSNLEYGSLHVQLIGGIVLHPGKNFRDGNGEEKLWWRTSRLSHALPDAACIVTVNNYLARLDAEWNGPIFEFLGLTVD